jgi:thiamine kinase-like enzyme
MSKKDIDFENSLPEKIIIERKANFSQFWYEVTIKTWDKKTYQGIVDDKDVIRLLKKYTEYVNHDRFSLPREK